jgi:hypothetical protein
MVFDIIVLLENFPAGTHSKIYFESWLQASNPTDVFCVISGYTL